MNLPIQNIDAASPFRSPTHIDHQSGKVLDVAGDVIGRSEPNELLTRKLAAYVGAVAAGRDVMPPMQKQSVEEYKVSLMQRPAFADDGRRLMDLRPSDVNTGIGYGIYSPTQDPIANVASAYDLVTQPIGTRYYEDPLSATKQVVQTGTEAGGQNPTVTANPIKVAYDCYEHGLACDVQNDMVGGQSDFDLLTAAAYRLGAALRLGREMRVATLLTTAANWAAGNQVAVANKWNGTLGDPLADLYSAMNKSTLPVTHIIVSEPVVPQMMVGTNANVVSRIQNFFMAWVAIQRQGDAAKNPMLQYQFPTIVVARMKNIAAGAPGYVWGQITSANAVLIRQVDDPNALSSSRTFRYTGTAPDGAADTEGYLLRSIYVPGGSGRGTRSLVLVTNDQERIINNTVGSIITGVLA